MKRRQPEIENGGEGATSTAVRDTIKLRGKKMSNTEYSNFPVVSQGEIGSSLIQTVNARDLHAFLETRVRFSDWIKKRIQDYDFKEGVDYVRLDLSPDMRMTAMGNEIGDIVDAEKNVALESTGYKDFGQQGRIEYAISIDMAKELSMVERNEKGKQARQYFLECERRAKDPMEALNNPATMRGLLLSYSEKVLRLQGQVDELSPKALALDRIATADGSLCITDAAKNLQVRPKDLFAYLRSHGWIYRRAGTDHDLAYQSKLVSGVMEHKTTTVYRSDGSEKITTQVRITPKGLTVLAKVFPSVATAA